MVEGQCRISVFLARMTSEYRGKARRNRKSGIETEIEKEY